MSRVDLAYEQPSRWSRVAVVISSLAVGFIAVWVLSPIFLANLAATSATVMTAREPTISVRTVAVPARAAMSAPREPREAKDLAITPPPAQTEQVQAAPAPEPVTEAAPEPAPGPVYAAVGATASAPAEPPAAAAAALPVEPADVEPAAGTDVVETSPPQDFGPVPLPRKRPSVSRTAALGVIPLPRPRPDTAPAEAPVDQSEALFSRMRYE